MGLSGVQGVNIVVKLGPYDFHDVENTDQIMVFSHENRIWCGMSLSLVKFE